MPVIDGIYTKDFPDLGRAILDTDLIIIAVVGDDVTYKTTVSTLNRQLIVTQANIFNPGDPYDDKYIVISPTIDDTKQLTFWIDSSQYVNKTLWNGALLSIVSGEYRLKGFPDEDFTIQINYI